MTTTSLNQLLREYQLPEQLGFARELAPVMYRVDYYDGKWHTGQLQPYDEISISPAANALQFGQQSFEGMKAYQVTQSSPALFRPEMNFRRLNRSAKRICIPEIPAQLFAEALIQVVDACKNFIPNNSGQSLYLRPTLLGTGPTFALKNVENFSFFLMASPSDAYYADPIKVMIERKQCRAAVGGTGADKVGGNYAAGLQSTQKCIDAGFDQPLWLDPDLRQNIEELSGMNVMAVIDGKLHTPSLNGSILPGVTRNSIIQLASVLNIEVVERDMPVDELLNDIRNGNCSEFFACGTAAIVCPISAVGDVDGTELPLPAIDKMAARIKAALLDIQEGRVADPLGWMHDASEEELLFKRLTQKHS